MVFPFTLKQAVVPVVSACRRRILFPVRRVYCIGQNYESHAREMGGHTSKNNPFFFTKPADGIVTRQVTPELGALPPTADAELSIRYPSATESYHYEVEMVVALGARHSAAPKEGAAQPPHHAAAEEDGDPLAYFNLSVEEANDVIYAYGIGLDMTRRDLQAQAKENGKPWDLAKGGDDCAVVSPLVLAQDLKVSHPKMFVAAESVAASASRAATGDGNSPSEPQWPSLDVKNGGIFLSVNGNERQKGNMHCMTNTPAEIISILSKFVTLHAGDLIFTGTPSGVGPVRRGDVLTAGVEGIGEIKVTVV